MLTSQLVQRGLVFRAVVKPDGSYALGVSPRDRVSSNLKTFLKNHKPEILDELFDIGAATMQGQLVTCPSCGNPARWWQDKNSETGVFVAWWICEECGRIYREQLE